MDKMNIYSKLPVFVQNLACYYEGSRIRRIRYGQDFWKYLNKYESRKGWTYEQLSEYRDERLKNMMKHCYESVPYYTKLFKKLGIDYRDIETIDDLHVLPILDKQTVNDNFEDFISTAIPKNKMIYAHTSGTTGSGFKFYTTNEAICEQWAVWWRYRRNLGIKFDTWCALFGSKLVVPIAQTKPPFWRINAPCRQIYFSAFHENEQNLQHYFQEIKVRKIKWIHGFPSLITLLAAYIVTNNLSFGYPLKYVTVGAENLLEHQKNIIEKAFGVAPIQHYGLAEGVANFSENLSHEIYVDEDFAAVEFIPEGKGYKVIGTNLTNFAMPLIRWDTKDIVTFIKDASGKRVIKSIDGRAEDYVTLPNGIRVGKLDHIFKDTVNLREVQIYQCADYSIVVYAVKKRSDVSDDEKVVRQIFRESIGDSINIEFKYVDRIPRASGGKLRFVVSEIKQEDGNVL